MNVKLGERPRSKLAPNPKASACLGRECPDKAKCLRFRRYTATGQRWATFDLERQLIDPRFCPAFEPI